MIPTYDYLITDALLFMTVCEEILADSTIEVSDELRNSLDAVQLEILETIETRFRNMSDEDLFSGLAEICTSIIVESES